MVFHKFTFSHINFFQYFLPLCNYSSRNNINIINICVCCCLDNTANFAKGAKSARRIKKFDRAKLFFLGTVCTDLCNEPQTCSYSLLCRRLFWSQFTSTACGRRNWNQKRRLKREGYQTCGLFSECLCRKIKMWKNGVFCFAKKNIFPILQIHWQSHNSLACCKKYPRRITIWQRLQKCRKQLVRPGAFANLAPCPWMTNCQLIVPSFLSNSQCQ